MNKATRKKILGMVLCLFMNFQYRGYNVVQIGASNAGQGGTGSTGTSGISSISKNPSTILTLDSISFTASLDSQIFLKSLTTKINLNFQYFPLLAFAMPVTTNSAFGVALYSLFQRQERTSQLVQYNLDITYGYSLTYFWSIAGTITPAFALQSNTYDGWGVGFSLSSLFTFQKYTIAIVYQRSPWIYYPDFLTNEVAEEKFPDIIRFGINYYWENLRINLGKYQLKIKKISVSAELEAVLWQYSYLKVNNENVTPEFEPSWTYFVHPHIGIQVEFENFLPGLILSTGFLTEDYINQIGENNNQILWTIGLGGYAGRGEWGNRFRIEMSYISSFALSWVNRSNHQIERVQVTFEYHH